MGFKIYNSNYKKNKLQEPILWLILIFFSNALIPTKLFRISGIPFGEFITILIYIKFLIKFFRFPNILFNDILGKIWLLCIFSVLISTIHGFYICSNKFYWFANVKQVIHYLFIFPLIFTIRNIEQYERLLKLYLIIAVLSGFWLQFLHFFPNHVSWDVGNGVIMGHGNYVRIFTPGMQYIFFCIVALLPYLLYTSKKIKILLIIIWIFLLFTLIWTYVRSYFIIIFICNIIFIIIMHKYNKLIKIFNLNIKILIFLIFLLIIFQKELENFFNRMNTLSAIKQKKVTELDTLGWRLFDAENAINVPQTPQEIAIGVFSKPYRSGGWYGAAPHIAYTGIFYHFGMLGVLIFGIMIIVISKNIYKLIILFKNDYKEIIAFLLVWISILLYSFFGGTFASSSNIISLTVLWYGIMLKMQQYNLMRKYEIKY